MLTSRGHSVQAKSEAIAVLALVATLAPVVGASPSAVCPVVEAPPQVDGILSDPAWADAFVYDGFTDNLGKAPAEPSMQFQAVTDGQVLVVMEAMKMEHSLLSPHDGTVIEVRHLAGDQVEADEVLVVVEEG